MGMIGNARQPLWPMPDGIETGHDCQQNLRRTDVRCGLLTADMLLTCLQCKAIGLPAPAILADSDKTPGD